TVDELRAVTDTFVEQLDLVDSQEVRGLLEKHIVEVDCIQTQLHCSLASVSTRIRDQGDQSTRINKLTSQLQSLEERPAPYTKAGLSIADVMGIATLDQVTNSRRQSLENELTELLSQCETHHSGGYLSNELKGLRSKAQRHDTMSPTDSTGRNSQDAFPYVVWTEARQEWFEQLKRLRQLLHRPWRLELSSNVAEDLDLAGLKYPEPEKVDENLLEKRMLQLQNYQKSCRILGGQEYDILLQRSMPIRSNCTADGSMLMDEYLQVNALELGTRVMRSEFEVLRLLQAQAEEEHTRLVCEQIGPFVDDEKNLNCLEDVEVCYGVAQFWLRLTHQWIRDSQVILDKTDAISNTINTSEKSASDDTYQLISTENSIALWTDGAEKLERCVSVGHEMLLSSIIRILLLSQVTTLGKLLEKLETASSMDALHGPPSSDVECHLAATLNSLSDALEQTTTWFAELGKLLGKLETASSMDALHGPPSSDVECHLAATLNSLSDAIEQTTTWFAEAHGEETDIAESSSTIVQTQNTHLCQLNSLRKDLSDLAIEMQSSISCPTLLRQSSMNTLTKESRDDTEERTNPCNWNRADQDSSSRYLKSRILESRQHLHRAVQELNTHVMSVSSDSWCHPDSEAIELPGMPDRIPTESCVSSYRDFAAYLEVEITQNAACIEIEEYSNSSRRPIQIKHLLDLMWSKLHDHLKVIVQLEETNQNTAGVQAVRLMVSDYSEPYATHDPSGNLLKMSSESLSRLRRLLDDDKIQNEEMGFSSKLCIEVTLFQTVCALLDAVLSNPAWNFLQRVENAAVERLLLLEFIHELLGLNMTSTLEEIQNTDSQDLKQISESLDKVIGLCDTFVNHTAEGSETFVFPGLMSLPVLFHRTMKKLAERHNAVRDFHTPVESDSQTEVRLAVLTMTCSQLRRFCTSVKECMSSRKVSSTKHPCRLAWQPYSTTEDMTTRVAYLSDCLVQIMNLVRQLMRTPVRSMEHLAEQHQNCMMISSKLAWDVVKATCLCCSVGSVLQDEQELSECRLSIDHSNVLPKAINNLINRMVIRSGKVYGLQQWWEQLSQQTQCFNEATSKLCDQLPGYPVELAPVIHLTFIEWMNEELTTSHQTLGLPSPSSVVHRMLSSSQALDQILKQQDLIRGFVWRLWELDGIGDELIIQLRRFHSHLATFEPRFPVRDSFHLINWNARFSAEWTRLIRWTKDLFVKLTECIHSVRWLEDRIIMFETKVKSSQRWLPQNSEMCMDQEVDVEALNSKLKHLELIYSEVTGSHATQLEYSDSGILLPTSSVETHSLLDILAGKRDQAYTMHNSLKRALEERMSELCGSLATLVEDPEIDSFSLLQRWFLIHLTNMDQQQPGNQLIDKIDRLRGNLHIWKNAYEKLNRRFPVLVQFLKVHTSTTKEALYRLHETWFALMEVAEGARERLLAKCIRYEELQRHIRLLEYEAEEFCRYNQSGDLLQYSDKSDCLMQYGFAVQKRKRERLAELFSRLDKLKEEVTLFATDTLRFTLPAYETCEQHVVEYQMNLLDLPGQVQRIQDKLNELNLDLSMNEDSVDEWNQLNQQQLQLFHGVGELEFLIQCAFAHHPIAITEKEKANYFGCLLNSVGFLQQKISERMRVWFAAMETGCSPWRACGTLDFYSQYMAKCQHFIDQLAKLKSANLIHSQMHQLYTTNKEFACLFPSQQFLLHRMALCEASRVRVVERAEAAQVHLCNMMQQTRILMRGCLVSQRVLEFCQRKSVTDLAGRYNEDGSCNPKPGITDVFDFLADYHVLSNLSGEMGLEKKGGDADGPKDAPGLDEWCALELDRVQQQICQTRDLVGLVVMHKQQQRLRWAQTQHIIGNMTWAQTQHIIGNMNNQLHKPSTSLTLRMKLLSVLIQLNPYLSPLSMARWLENCPDRPLATSCNREDGVSFFDRLFRLENALKSIDEQREPQVSGPQEVIVSPEVVDTGDWNLSSIVDAYSKQMTIWPQILSCTKLAIKMVVHGDDCAAKHLLPLLSRLLDVNNRLFQCTTVVENILEQWFHFLYLRSQVSNQILDNELERFRTRLEDKNVNTFEADGSIADQLKMLEGYESSFGQLCNLDEYILIPPSSTEDGHPRLFSDPVCVRWRLQQKLITESSEAGECYRAHLTRIDAKILDAFGLLRDLTIATHDLSKRDTEMLQEHSNVLRESWVLVKEFYTGFGHAAASDRVTHISTSSPVVFGVQLTLVDLLLLWCNILNTTLHQAVLSQQQFVEMRCGLRAMLDKLSIVPGSGCNALSVLPDPTASSPFTSNRSHIEGISVPHLGWMLTQTELQSARFQERIDYELSRNLGWIKLLSLAASDRNTQMDLSVLTDTARRVRSERAALLCYSSYEKKRSRIANGVLQQARLLLPQIHRQLDRYQHHARISNTSLLQQNSLQLLLKRTFMQYLRTGLLRMPSPTGSAEIYQDFAVRLESAFERSILELLKITRLGRQSTSVTISKSDSCSNLDVNWSSPIDDWLKRIDAMESSKEENLVECIPEWLTDIKQMLAESSTVKVEQISENHGNPSEKLQRRRRRGPSPGKIRVGLQNKLEQVVTKLRSLLRRGSEISSRLRHNQDWKSSIDHLTRMGRTTLAKRMRRDQIKKLRVLQDLRLEFEQVERDWVKRTWMSGGNIDIEITVLAQRLKSIMNFGHSLCVKLEQELSMVIQEDNLPSHDWDNSIHSSDTKSCTLCSAIAEFDESPLIFHHIPNDRLEHVQTPTVNRTQQTHALPGMIITFPRNSVEDSNIPGCKQAHTLRAGRPTVNSSVPLVKASETLCFGPFYEEIGKNDNEISMVADKIFRCKHCRTDTKLHMISPQQLHSQEPPIPMFNKSMTGLPHSTRSGHKVHQCRLQQWSPHSTTRLHRHRSVGSLDELNKGATRCYSFSSKAYSTLNPSQETSCSVPPYRALYYCDDNCLEEPQMGPFNQTFATNNNGLTPELEGNESRPEEANSSRRTIKPRRQRHRSITVAIKPHTDVEPSARDVAPEVVVEETRSLDEGLADDDEGHSVSSEPQKSEPLGYFESLSWAMKPPISPRRVFTQAIISSRSRSSSRPNLLIDYPSVLISSEPSGVLPSHTPKPRKRYQPPLTEPFNTKGDEPSSTMDSKVDLWSHITDGLEFTEHRVESEGDGAPSSELYPKPTVRSRVKNTPSTLVPLNERTVVTCDSLEFDSVEKNNRKSFVYETRQQLVCEEHSSFEICFDPFHFLGLSSTAIYYLIYRAQYYCTIQTFEPTMSLSHTCYLSEQPVCTVLSPAENSWPFESMRQHHSLDEYLPDHELFEEEETQSLCCDDIGNDSCIQIQAPAVYEPEQLQPTDYNRCPGTKRLPHFKDSTSERTGGREWSHQTSTISTQVSEEELVRQLRALCAQANRRATELIAITVDEPEFLSASCDQLRTFLGQLEAYNFRVHTLSSLNSARSAADEKPLISGEWTRTLKATRTWLCELQKAFATSKGLEQLISEFQQHMKETELSVHPTRYSSTSTTSLARGFDHEREHIRNKFNRREEGLPHVPTTVRLLRVIRFRLSEWLAHFNLLLLTPETLEVLPAIAALNPLPQTDEMIGSQLVCLRSCFGGLLDDAERLLAQWSVRCRQHLGVGRNKEREQELTPTVFSTPRRTGCDSLDTSFERPLASEVRHRYVSTAGSTQLFHRGDPDSMMTSDTDDNIEELVSVTSRSSVSPVSDASEDLINLEQATDTSWASELTPTRSLARSDHTLRGMSRGQNIYSRHSTPLLRIEPIPTTRLVPSGMSREPVSLDDFRNEQVVDKPDDEEQCSTLSTLKESSDVCAPATFEPSEPVHSLVPSTQSINDPEKVQQPRFLPLIQFIKSTAIFRRSVELLATFSRTVISENRFDPHQPGQYDTNFNHSPNFTRSFGESIPEPPGYYVQPMEDKFFRLQLTSSKNVHRFRFIPPRLQNFSLIILLTLLLLFALPLFCYWLHVVPYFGSDCVYTSPWSGGPASVVSGHAFAKSWPNNAPPS
ncbi:hypothetical protein T265_12766, partial [Opisthorchis viverrini]